MKHLFTPFALAIATLILSCSTSLAQVIVSGPGNVWSGSFPPAAETQGIELMPGAQLTLQSVGMAFGPNICIRVHEGASLTVNQSNLHSASPNFLWQGIKADGSVILSGPQNPAVTVDNSIVSGARIAIDMQSDATHRARSVSANFSWFFNNLLAVHIANPAPFMRHNFSSFVSCTFATENTLSVHLMELDYIIYTNIVSCNFVELESASVFGVNAANCIAIHVGGTPTVPSQFAVRCGVRWNRVHKSSISNIVGMEEQSHALHLQNCLSTHIHNNQINGASDFGFSLQNCSDFLIEDNQIQGLSSPNAEGIFVDGSGSLNNYVINNNIVNWEEGVIAEGNNSRLHFRCNNFNNNGTHILVESPLTTFGIAQDQSVSGTEDPNNTFGASTFGDILINLPTGSGLNYTYRATPANMGLTVTNLTLIPTATLFDCNSSNKMASPSQGGFLPENDNLTFSAFAESFASSKSSASQYLRINASLSNRDWDKAELLLAQLPAQCNLSQQEQAQYRIYKEVYKLLLHNGRTANGTMVFEGKEQERLQWLHEQEIELLETEENEAHSHQHEATPYTFAGQFLRQAAQSEQHSQVSNGVAFQLFPNPAKDRLNIAFEPGFNETAQVEIVSVTGQVVYSAAINESNAAISLEGIGVGYYLCRVTTASGESIQKLVVQ